MSANFYVYVLTNRYNTVFYTGFTNDIDRRIWEHRNVPNPRSFARRYRLHKLVYVQRFDDPITAIKWEKKLKRWRRQEKIRLISQRNPDWKELSLSDGSLPPDVIANRTQKDD